MSIPVARLNHAVLYVRDTPRAADLYTRVFGFEVVEGAVMPLDLDAEVRRWGSAGGAR